MTEFNQTPEQHRTFSENTASVASAIAGNYSFQIGDLISEAWEKINGRKGTIWMGILFYMLAIIPILFIIGLVWQPTSYIGLALSQIIQTIILLPLGMGFYMIGVKIASNTPTDGKEVFSYFNKIVPLAITYLLMIILTGIGFLLLILPGIYLVVAYQMAMPLVVEKNLSPWEALEASRKSITHNWFKYFGLLIVVSIIVMISILPLGIGLIWSLPLAIVTYGIVYVKMYGYSGK